MPDIAYTALDTILTRLQARETSAAALLDHTLARIARFNPHIGALSAVIETRAKADAARVDAQRRTQWVAKGPLAGLPIVVKDIIDTTPAVCSAGLPFLEDYRPTRDAEVVNRLRAAGAVVVGVATSDPGAFGVRTDATDHPQAPGRSVGGSSGGSAAALAAGFAFAALGTDTGGSVRIPAACCMTTSLKPTFDRIPTDGVRPLAWSLDHVGTMTRRVSDIPTIQEILDPGFHGTRSDLRPEKAVIGIDFDYFADADPAVQDAMADTLKTCEAMGCRIASVHLPAPDDVLGIHGTLLFADAAAYYQSAGLADHPQMPPFPREGIDLGSKLSAPQYALAAHHRKQFSHQVQAALKDADVLMVPTLPVLTPLKTTTTITLDGRECDYTSALVRYTSLFNHTGNPVVAMPVNVLGPGLGIGIQVVARHHRDADALAFSRALEQALSLPIDWDVRF